MPVPAQQNTPSPRRAMVLVPLNKCKITIMRGQQEQQTEFASFIGEKQLNMSPQFKLLCTSNITVLLSIYIPIVGCSTNLLAVYLSLLLLLNWWVGMMIDGRPPLQSPPLIDHQYRPRHGHLSPSTDSRRASSSSCTTSTCRCKKLAHKNVNDQTNKQQVSTLTTKAVNSVSSSMAPTTAGSSMSSCSQRAFLTHHYNLTSKEPRQYSIKYLLTSSAMRSTPSLSCTKGVCFQAQCLNKFSLECLNKLKNNQHTFTATNRRGSTGV